MMNRWSVPRTLGAKEEYGSLLWAQLGGFLEEAARGWSRIEGITPHGACVIITPGLEMRLRGSEVVK